MPIATGVMLLTNVGLAIFNNWRGANNSKELQQKQREFQKAAQERNHERMKQLLREGQELNSQIEEELHKNRLDNIERDFDNLINRIFAADAINSWPLKVLPMVMKNESLGTLFTHQEESVALHCILTPSNNANFNKYVFPQLEREVEAFCNSNLTSLSSHPVIFYGGAWKSGIAPTGPEIDQLVADLPNLPMLLITPFFKPNNGGLAFHITTWGMCERQFMEIIPTTQFDYAYTEDLEYSNDVILNSVEQFSAYLESLIGYFADVYFWSAYNQMPITPLMIAGNIINTDGALSLIQENKQRYSDLYKASISSFENSFIYINNCLRLLSGISPFHNKNEVDAKINEAIITYYTLLSGLQSNITNFDDALNYDSYNKKDIPFFQECLAIYNDEQKKKRIRGLVANIQEAIGIEQNDILSSLDIQKLMLLADSGNGNADYRLFEIFEYSLTNEYSPEVSKEHLTNAFNSNNPFAILYHLLVAGDIENSQHTNHLISSLQPGDNVQSAIFKALALYKGVGIKQSIESAMDILEQYSETKHPFVSYFASKIVYEQYDNQPDLIIELLKKSATLGYVQAQIDLMNIYFEGKTVSKDPELCIKYAQDASLQGEPEALFTLGYCFLVGFGAEKNKSKAIYFLNLAKDRGSEDAQALLKKIK